MSDSTAQVSGRILITGASGFIGSHLLRRLVEQGTAELHAISRRRQPGAGTAVRWWEGDLADQAQVRTLLSRIRPDVIFHLAGHVAGTRDLELVMPTFQSNLASTVYLLDAAARMGCRRFILTGSLEEPDAARPGEVPASPYAAAKWAAGAYARMFHALFAFPVVVLRVFMVYGPAQRDERKLIPYVIHSLLSSEPPKLTSGMREVDWIYVDDVVDGFLAAAATAGIEGSTLDLGSGELAPIRMVVERLTDMINPQISPLYGAIADRPFEQIRIADAARTESMLGWRAQVPLNDGLARTVEWYRRRAGAGA